MKKAASASSKLSKPGEGKPSATGMKKPSVKARLLPDDVDFLGATISDPLVVVSCDQPLAGYVSLTNSGSAPVTLKVWTREEGRPGIPEGGLLLEVPLYQGDTITHTASNVIRFQFEAGGSESQRRYSFTVKFTASNGVPSPPEFSVRSTKVGKLKVQVYNNANNKWVTSLSVSGPGQPRYKTRIDPDVQGTLTKVGAEMSIKSHDGAGTLPYRVVQFDS